MSTPTNGKEVVLEAEEVVAGYVSEVDILNGVSMTVRDGEIYTCGTKLSALWRIDAPRLQKYAATPFGTHNTRPFRDGVLFNHTKTDRIAYATRDGRVLRSVQLPTYRDENLEHADLPSDLARPTFGRGLTVLDDGRLVGGSSPATVTVARLSTS